MRQIHPSAYVAPNAVIDGDVTIGAETVVSYGAVLVADGGRIVIGHNTVVMEQAVIRSSAHHDCVIGHHVMVGPHTHLAGCTVGDECFIATGASVFNGASLGKLSEVRINGVVHLRTRLPENSTVPIGWIAVGDPAQLFSPDRHDEIWAVQQQLDFPRNVFGVSRGGSSTDSPVKQITGKYGRYLLRTRNRRDD
ncbi:gamma carbonic anhydrase family protein [Paraburkholderia rhizosphaerae]|uniref:Carbonic anhydrase/acetyltransferase-like protein (Isoleucine patch superfamily) n=1 Tax=Paraburkholderia rhizosphaerae TaxID=480658 RepID=A0A4R8LHK6_9BURK|nr:gamma carbonic anhydrase family protein [Paraburkholderia rhizosphaerae]TDY42245.1 carbonic anhydrase/acetyltransferase-like protein (isoleucine patch superfamily) [Paraburkholderia rhizosphaerae]